MNEGLEKYKLTSINRSIYSIIIALTASLMLSLIVIVLTVRSITGPVNVLVRGIGRVSTGDFDSKVNITSHDEIGYIADTFNDMIVNLKEVTLKKEELMSELREINIDLEERVRQATEELRMAHEKMLHTETLSIVGTFASGVAHEMATPLSSLISYVQMLKGKFQGRKGVEDLNIIEGELHRLRIILGGMLDFARVPKKEKLSTDINSIINELMSLLRYQKEYKNIMVKTDVDTGIPAISAVPGQLKQVFMNIIMNALQAMPDGGELTVSTSATGDNKKVIIRIEDTGYGISRDVIDRVFQPFYTNKKSGTGLGLSISYGIIKGHHGDITVESRVDKGTVFTITLPV
jgi:two-component system NtrC family sensor kinase